MCTCLVSIKWHILYVIHYSSYRFPCDCDGISSIIVFAPRFGLNKMLVTGSLLFIASLFEYGHILVSSEGIKALDENIFASHGAEFHMLSIIKKYSDGYTSTNPTKAFGHVYEFREFYLRNYKLEDHNINVRQNYNITHISERAFEWASDVVVSKFHKVRSSFQRQFIFFFYLIQFSLSSNNIKVSLKLLQCKLICW